MNDEAKNKVLEVIDEVTRPEDMSPEEHVEFLEELIGDLQTRLDAARDDVKK